MATLQEKWNAITKALEDLSQMNDIARIAIEAKIAGVPLAADQRTALLDQYNTLLTDLKVQVAVM